MHLDDKYQMFPKDRSHADHFWPPEMEVWDEKQQCNRKSPKDTLFLCHVSLTPFPSDNEKIFQKKCDFVIFIFSVCVCVCVGSGNLGSCKGAEMLLYLLLKAQLMKSS